MTPISAALALAAALALTLPAAAPRAEDAAAGAAAEALREAGLAVRGEEASAMPEGAPLPFEIAPHFRLTDQHGREVTEADFAGRPYALFFGYVSCQSICSVVLPRIAGATNILLDAGLEVTPVVVTIDPARDTPEALAEALPQWHEKLVGLTGSEAELQAVRDIFQVQMEKVAELPDGSPVYAHGSFVYLVGPDGKVLTLLPPIISPRRMAEVFASYL
ncbi:MAG: SCO family protein [Albimonas sp.]|uniref:SCO family protein n=1 Tax=Albimonas sp. TaxID=1872425 RepID=UPI0040569C9C|tara:strand:- start:299 stop:955 length:657 start_codon:yes stop_codon:yes gene_type:complete